MGVAVMMISLSATPVLGVSDYRGWGVVEIRSEVPREYREIVARAARAEGVPERIVAKLMASESSWREWMIAGPNSDGSYDYGIAGFNSRYMVWFQTVLGVFNPFRAEEAIPKAARWLRMLYDEFGDWGLAVTAYKCGAKRTARGGVPRWVELIAKEVVR